MSACPICGRIMLFRPSERANPRYRTEDHILPQHRGGARRLGRDIRNIRLVCRRCNLLRAQCGDCTAAAAIALHLERDTGIAAADIARRWRYAYRAAR